MPTIENREFLKDITTSATANTFNFETFLVQPSNTKTFPWLSTIAQCYDQYYIHGIEFFFRSAAGDNTTTGSAGTIILAAEYNVNASPYYSKQVMENSSGAISVKQQSNAILKLKEVDRVLFTRTQPVPAGDSTKFYDHSIFQIATTGFPASFGVVGELWVSYKISFAKPQIPRNLGGNMESTVLTRTGADSTNRLGTATTTVRGSVDLTVDVNSVTISNVPTGGLYYFQFYWSGTSTAISGVGSTHDGGAPPIFANFAFASAQLGNGLTTTNAWHGRYLIVQPGNSNTVTLTGTIPPGSVDIFVTEVDRLILSGTGF